MPRIELLPNELICHLWPAEPPIAEKKTDPKTATGNKIFQFLNSISV
jgi:hypothetical protein